MGSVSSIKGVLITGASTGIGEAVALHLDRLGFQVFAGVRKQTDAESLERRTSERLVPVFLDITDEAMISRSVEQVSQVVGESGLAGLVNNAGIAVASPLEFIPIQEFRRQLEVNLIGQLAVTQAFLPLIRKGQGRLIFISSISGRVAAPLLGPYAASKFALGAIADSLRRELLPWNIQVSLVEPGRIVTPIWEKSLAAAEKIVAGLDPQAEEFYGEVLEKNRKRVTQGSKGTPVERVAEVVAEALLSKNPRARYLVGRDARFAALLVKLLPDKLFDRVIARQRGIERPK